MDMLLPIHGYAITHSWLCYHPFMICYYPFIDMLLPIHGYDITHSCIWYYPFLDMVLLIHGYGITHSWICYYPFMDMVLPMHATFTVQYPIPIKWKLSNSIVKPIQYIFIYIIVYFPISTVSKFSYCICGII
jgi:hypothetical protein